MQLQSNTVTKRAVATKGTSSSAIYRLVARVLAERHSSRGTLLDVGCGQGELREHVAAYADTYIGADVVRYEQFPADVSFIQIDLDAGRIPLPDACADLVVAVETIEHLENPRAFFRGLTRLAKPGGLIQLTTPNQLSFLSLCTLLVKGQYNAFQAAPGLYPAHITALLEIDLRRMAEECRSENIEIIFSNQGRIPFTAWSWPNFPLFHGRRFSDGILLSAHTAQKESVRTS